MVSQLVLQGDRKEAIGEAFFASSDAAIPIDELMRMIAVELGVTTRTIHIPQLLLAALGQGADAVSLLTGKSLPISRKLARQLLAPGWTCSTEKAQRLLGHRAKVKLTDSVRRTIKGYSEAGWL